MKQPKKKISKAAINKTFSLIREGRKKREASKDKVKNSLYWQRQRRNKMNRGNQ